MAMVDPIRGVTMGSYPYTRMYRSESIEEQRQSLVTMMEKRQLFLRSYRFSRKRSFAERLRRSLVRAKRVFLLRLRSFRSRLSRFRLVRRPTRRPAIFFSFPFLRLSNNETHKYYGAHTHHHHQDHNSSSSSCFSHLFY